MTHRFISHANPKLAHYLFENGTTSFRVFPKMGGSVLEWNHAGTHILTPFSITEAGLDYYKAFYKSSILFPFPNRLKGGKFVHEGNQYELPINEVNNANAIHGCVSNASFSVASVSHSTITLKYEHKPDSLFPFAFALQIVYEFSPRGMTSTFRVSNLDQNSFPFGLGWHPYFNLVDDTQTELYFNSSKTYTVDSQMIPIKTEPTIIQSLALKDTSLDTAFQLDEPEVILKTPEYELNMDMSGFDFLQLFIPDDRKSIAIEPMTCIANAFNNDIGKMILEPKATAEFTIRLSILS